MAEEWLIDGYNLLHAHASVKSTRSRKSREQLLAELAGFSALEGRPVTVVLDGAGDPGELDIHRTALFAVVYSQNVSADACIERQLYERRGTVHFTVVTDDRAITNIARGSGASVVGCGEFLEVMKASVKERSERSGKDRMRSRGFNRPFEDKL